jgi:hypothetical protein
VTFHHVHSPCSLYNHNCDDFNKGHKFNRLPLLSQISFSMISLSTACEHYVLSVIHSDIFGDPVFTIETSIMKRVVCWLLSDLKHINYIFVSIEP